MAKHIYKNTNLEVPTVGNPIQYKPEYCDMLIEHMSNGLSFEAFAGAIGVCKKTLYNWMHNFPEFEKAREIAVSKHLLYMMKNATDGMWNTQGEGSRNLNFSVWRFVMKNIHGWRDTVDAEQKTEVNVSGMSDEDLKKIVIDAAEDLKIANAKAANVTKKKWPKKK